MKKINIKKAAGIGICCTIISTSTVFAVSDNFSIKEDIIIQINNEWVKEGIEPVIENNRTMVPLNEFMEKLGAMVKSDLKTGMIEVCYGDVTIELNVGKNSAKIIENDGGSLKEEEVNLEISPRAEGEKVFVPLRFAAEALGFDVQWDNSLKAVIIKTEGDVIAVEKPVEFETVTKKAIESNELLTNLYKNHMNKGIYSLMDGDYIYVLVSAGEKLTGGYSMEVDSITEVAPRTAYIHAVLSSPSAESYVTQALTYPCVMVKFSKGDIQNIQWDLSGDIQPDENENNEVIKFIQEFGERLKMVSLTAPEDVLKNTMEKYYGDYVSAGLIEKWLTDPANAPGRLTSSPWPGRIDVLSAEKTAENEYAVKGMIVEFTSVEMEDGGFAAKEAITLKVDKINGKWVITDAELDSEGMAENSVVYKNEKYGFSFELPESWNSYSIKSDVWEGISLKDGSKSATGPVIYIRHPQWTKDNPRQDIPVMIFTAKQWDSLQNDEFGVGAAPMAPSMLGENSDYVFALPASYNYAFLTGYEEVEEIFESNPLKVFEIK